MKRTMRVLPMVAAISACAMLIGASAQESNRRTAAGAVQAQEQAQPQMSMVFINKVKPSMTTQYEQALREVCGLLSQYNADPEAVNFFSVSGPELGYVMVIPLKDGFNSMDDVRSGWMSTVESIGLERFQKLFDKMDACIESHAMIHSVYRDDLSYIPAKPAIKDEDIKFAHYEFMYAFPGQEEEFAAIAQEWKALYTKHNINTGWRVQEKITGEDLPAYAIIEVGTSEAAFYANRDKVYEKIGADAADLAERSSKVVRKVEQMVGYPRPDLSYPNPGAGAK